MPLYRCMSPEESLTSEGRENIAKAITEIHCDVTGAPTTFVHVFFLDPEGGEQHRVLGSIRAGRTEEQRAAIHRRIAEAYAGQVGVSPDAISVSTMDIPSKWTMEGGSLLPEPGEEEEWLAAHSS